ncbi:hypothetical protein Osc1_19970 [Hominimerdicola sp. 21CYCFAH17_S]
MKKKRTQSKDRVNNSVINVISPQSLVNNIKDIEISGYKAEGYFVHKYPSRLDYGWLTRIVNMENSIVSIGVSPIDESDFLDALNRNIINKENEAEENNNPLKQQRAETAANDSRKLMQEIDNEGISVCQMGLNFLTIAPNDKELQRASRRARSILSGMGIKTRLASRRQDKILKQCVPTYTLDPEVNQISNRIVPLTTLIGGFPFSSSGFSDKNGDYFAKSLDNNIMMIDYWLRGDDRTNSNMVIMGQAGQGKSAFVKAFAIIQFKNGVKQIFIDPDAEYVELAHNLGGAVINLGGGGNTRINPLEIRPAPKDDEKELNRLYIDEGNGMGDLALHIKTLEIFFSMYLPDLTMIQKSLLKKTIIELYRQFDITWETDAAKLSHTDFPIFSDLHKLLKQRLEESGGDKDYRELVELLTDISEGSDSFIWNGHTTLDTEADIIVLNTKALQTTPDAVKRTQYFNILTWCWEQMTKDRDTKVLLYEDEAYLSIDRSVPQSLAWHRNSIKQDRKYEAGIVIISHSVVDFLDPDIKMYGQAMLDIPCYKVLFGTDGQNLLELKQLYNLTEAEEELLLKKKRGQALFLAGAKRLGVRFEIPEYKLKLMGTAGGR